jgi:hypothetical protein
MRNDSGSVQCAGGHLGQHRHICAFFNGIDEEHRVLRPFFKEGFERGERAFHIVDPELREEHLRRLAEAGIEVDRAMSTGQLEIRRWQDAYLRDGRFDQDAMLALLETRVNYVVPKYDDPVICVYDLSKFSAAMVMDMLRTHPVLIVGETLHENPFFVPPDQFLLEIRERRRSARAQ